MKGENGFAKGLSREECVIRHAPLHAALEVNLPNYANAIVPTSDLVKAISALDAIGKDPIPHVA